MENNSANVPPTKGSTGVGAAGKAGERETNAPSLFMAPQAAEERETNAPCLRETAKNTGTRETNVSEKDAAAVRRDEGPLTIAEQQLRQEVQKVQPGSEGSGHRGCSTDSRSGSWRRGEDRRISAQHDRCLPGRDASNPDQQRWFSQPQKVPTASAEPDAEGGVRVLQP